MQHITLKGFERHELEQMMLKSGFLAEAETLVNRYKDEYAPEEVFGQLEKLRPHMSRQFWAETVSWATASGTAIASSTTETILFPNVTIPANFMQDGRSLRLTAMGSYGTTGTPTLIFAVRWGGVSGTVITKSGAVVTFSGAGSGASSLAMWQLEVWLTVRSNGSSGTIMGNGFGQMWSSTVPTAGTATNMGTTFPLCNGGQTTPAAATCDLTADTALSLTALWGTNNAANTIQGLNYYIEALN
jgi:hypothetical protein